MTRHPAYQIAYWIVCVVFWLAPFFVAGATKKTWRILPHALRHQHSAANLFSHKAKFWSDWHLEAQRADGSRYEVSERDHFPMGVFGARTRYDRIMAHVDRRPNAKAVRRRLAEYVLRREQERTGVGNVLHLRLVRSDWNVGSPELARPGGGWSVPPVTELDRQNRVVVGGYTLSSQGRFAAFWEQGDPMPRRETIRDERIVIHAPARRPAGEEGGGATGRGVATPLPPKREGPAEPRRLVAPPEDAARRDAGPAPRENGNPRSQGSRE